MNTKPTTLTELKTMTAADLDTFAGAEAFADGSAPLIATLTIPGRQGLKAALVWDARGWWIMSEDGRIWFRKVGAPIAQRRTVLSVIARTLSTVADLEAAAFELRD